MSDGNGGASRKVTVAVRARYFALTWLVPLALACTPIGNPRKQSSSENMTVEAVDAGQHSSEPPSERAKPAKVESETTEPAADSTECASREPGDLFCDADALMHVCLSSSASRPVPCGELERCVEAGGRTKCGCVPGAVLLDSACVTATSCAVENGGCDPLTKCHASGSGRTCGDCPEGYVGDGLQGCVPQLTLLQPSCGELEPPLAAGVYDYRLTLPLGCHALQFASDAPANTRSTADGAELMGPMAGWAVVPVKYGMTEHSLVVTSAFGVSSKYKIVVERSGRQEAYIKASNADAEDKLGFSLAAAGGELIAGAPWEDSASLDLTDNAAANSGAVYTFMQLADGWTQQAYLKANPVSANEFFGASLAVSADTLVIGAPNLDPLQWYGGSGVLGSRSGAVYVFQRQNGAWTQVQRLLASDGAAGDLFGYKVALDNDTLVVGAPGDSAGGVLRSGAAYVFQREGGMWQEQQKLLAPEARDSSMFGLSLLVTGEQIVVGAPNESLSAQKAGAAYVFVREGTAWEMAQRLEAKTPKEGATFGWQIIKHADQILISAPAVVRVGPPGELSIFEQSAGAWTVLDTKLAAYSANADLFGGALASSGSMLVVGANGDSSGTSGLQGDASRTDLYQSGAVYLFAPSDRDWLPSTYIKAGNPDESDYFGVAVAIGEDQTVFVAASYESGASRRINGDAASNSVSHSGAVYVYR